MHSDSPGKRAFYKYMSPDTTLAVLANRSVRYSSPLSFNDPFDVQSGLHFDFNIARLHERVIDRIHVLAADPSAPELDTDNVWGQLVLKAREFYPVHGFDRDRWIKITASAFSELIRVITDTQKQYQTHWQNNLLPGVRVFCVSEDRDNLLMWAHYGRDHTGAVVELWSLPQEDNLLSVARPVEYIQSPVPFFTETQWIEDLTGGKQLDFKALYRRYAYMKSDHWSYEREWRVWYPYSKSTEPHDTVSLRQSEVVALYFGCRASADFIRRALELQRTSFPGAKAFKARKLESAYAVEYTEI